MVGPAKCGCASPGWVRWFWTWGWSAPACWRPNSGVLGEPYPPGPVGQDFDHRWSLPFPRRVGSFCPFRANSCPVLGCTALRGVPTLFRVVGAGPLPAYFRGRSPLGCVEPELHSLHPVWVPYPIFGASISNLTPFSFPCVSLGGSLCGLCVPCGAPLHFSLLSHSSY